MKIVLNKCFGGFGVSEKVYQELGIKWDNYGDLDNASFDIEGGDYNAFRTNKKLIEAIEKVGVKEASGKLANLEIIDIPDDIEWEIDEYDGIESVHEQHRSW